MRTAFDLSTKFQKFRHVEFDTPLVLQFENDDFLTPTSREVPYFTNMFATKYVRPHTGVQSTRTSIEEDIYEQKVVIPPAVSRIRLVTGILLIKQNPFWT